ncbi:glycoside hydrolase family 16 protein [Serpula lacrymans var. lacrymans S7.3]|uniref:Glycoside hydrolase family 16 protein n=1 Tax=Serpula lacrymans var. lacrymans (strain S7.3) TaxID=936435 RepID=F8Q404_SERL3|nr:glycoside hydrolase family 16 protein [Serpula lacrymans var. lacrymans S7.3]
MLRSLFYLLFVQGAVVAFPDILHDTLGFKSGLFSRLPEVRNPGSELSNKRDVSYDATTNISTVLWVIEDTYEGQTFFDTFHFYTGPDPTNFVDEQTAYNSSLAYVTPDNKIIMQGDNTTWLPQGVNRSSVRISSQAVYNTGLFILDLDMAPWGCAVWPAFWTLGSGVWPYNGEIDILEGVHDNSHNQVTWHTAPGCTLTPTTNFTGTIDQINGVDNLECNSLINDNAGCSVTEWSNASYGPYFDAQGGGAFAMKWDEEGIAVWSFYRAAIPQDIVQGEPNPTNWGSPVASLAPQTCNMTEYFANHSIIFDITFCGDWAGNSYATSGCPGTCPERLMDPANFVNASWIINSLKVYKKATLSGGASNGVAEYPISAVMGWIVIGLILNFGLLTL